MTMTHAVHELVLNRVFDAPPALVWKAWTEPHHVMQWWAPKPFLTVECDIDLRVGGVHRTLMQSPDGQKYPNVGVFLEIVPQKKLVFTDAYSDAWTPSPKPFMTAIMTFEAQGRKTKYTARALHWTQTDREEHEKMGFHEGWGTAADQLAAVLANM
jgi:uncharacterized protein YndB with AHSA1/START domain